MAGKGEGHAIGIDLGTTYSCVGVWQHDRVEIGDDQGNRTTPSYVASTDTEHSIGDAAKNQVAVNPIDTVVASLVAMPTLSGFLSIKLDQTNYPLWRAQIVPLLKSKKLLGYVDGSLPCPQAFLMDSEGKPTNVENPDHLFWHQQDQLILSWINKSLTPQVLSTVTRFQSSHESWAFLERRYAAQSHHHIQQRLGELHNTMRDELPIADYVDKLNGIADKLALIGHLVEDSLLVTLLMNNVGQTFEVTIASAQARDTPIGLDDLIALLLSAEQRQKGLPRLRSTPGPTTLSSPKKSSGQSRGKSRFKSAKVSSRRRGSSTGGSSDASTPKSSNSSSNDWWQSSGRPRGFGIDNLMVLLLSTEQRQKGSIPGATAIENKSSSQPEGKSGFNSANGSSRGHGSSTRGFSNASNRGFPKSLNSSSIGRQSSGQSRGKSGLNSANGSSRRCGSSTRGSSNASNRGCPKSSNSSSSSRPRCQICGRLGHTAIDCYYRMNMAYEGRVPTQKLSALAASSGFNNGGTNGGNTWYTDSGASNHVNSDLAK